MPSSITANQQFLNRMHEIRVLAEIIITKPTVINIKRLKGEKGEMDIFMLKSRIDLFKHHEVRVLPPGVRSLSVVLEIVVNTCLKISLESSGTVLCERTTIVNHRFAHP